MNKKRIPFANFQFLLDEGFMLISDRKATMRPILSAHTMPKSLDVALLCFRFLSMPAR